MTSLRWLALALGLVGCNTGGEAIDDIALPQCKNGVMPGSSCNPVDNVCEDKQGNELVCTDGKWQCVNNSCFDMSVPVEIDMKGTD